jgi:hypothetical protein
MALTTIPAAGAKVRGSVLSNLLTEVRPLAVTKSVDESVNSGTTGTTLQNDDALVLPGIASAVYLCKLAAIVNGAATPNFKCAFSLPSGATMPGWKFCFGLTGAIARGICLPAATVNGLDTTGADQPLELTGILYMGGTAGNIQWQWAQNVSDAGNVTVKANSYFEMTRIS